MAIRLSGLTSGMDTDAIVQELVSAYSLKTEKYEKASTKLTWKQDAWKGLNTKIYDLYTKVSSMRFSSAYNLRKTSVSDPTKALVTASSNAITGTQKLKIESTSQSAYMTGAKLSTLISDKDGDKAAGDTTLGDLGYTGNYTVIKYKCNGETKEIGVKKETTITEFINELKDIGLNASLDENNRRIFVNAKTSGEKSNFTLVGDSVDALEALTALGLNEPLINEKGEFTDAAGSFKEYYKYYTTALGALLPEPSEPTIDEITTAPTLPNKNDYADEEAYEEALADYQSDLDEYLTSYTEWSVYRANVDNYPQYKKDYILAKSETFADYENAMSAAGYTVDDIVGDADTYNENRDKAIDDVLLYQMKDNYAKYKAAFRENTNLQIAYTTLENQNKAWEDRLHVLENQQAARTSLDNMMETINLYHTDGLLAEYTEEEISGLIKELHGIDIYEVDKNGKKTGKISEAALNKAKELCKGKVPEPDSKDAVVWEMRITREAEELLGVFDNKSEDVENIENYVKSHDNITSIQLEDTTDVEGGLVKGVNSQITDIEAKIAENNNTLEDYKADMQSNQKFIDANAEMKDIDVLDANNTVNEARLEAELMAFVEKAKKANEIFTNPDKYDAGEDTAMKIDGSNAKIELNGVIYTSESNSFSINGLTINALAETEGELSITTSVDTQGIYDKVKEFLTEYNNVINEMTKLYNAESASDYEPLTDEEKEAMSDEQIEKWESKIKDSLLRRDTTLNSIMSTMVNAMAQTIEIGGQKISLSTFGIQTLGFLNAPKNEHYAFHINGDEDDENTSGKEDKLMKAIEENPEQIEEFMKKLCENLYTAIDNKMKSTDLSSAYKVYNDKEMDKELKKYADAISKWEEKVADKEEYYYNKFSQMEVALSKLQNQTSSLSGLFGM